MRFESICHISLESPFNTNFKNINFKIILVASHIISAIQNLIFLKNLYLLADLGSYEHDLKIDIFKVCVKRAYMNRQEP